MPRETIYRCDICRDVCPQEAFRFYEVRPDGLNEPGESGPKYLLFNVECAQPEYEFLICESCQEVISYEDS